MKKIRTKITLTYVLLAVVVVVSLGIISSIKIESFFHDRLVTQLSTLANVISVIVQDDTIADHEQLDYRIKSIAQAENVRISIINADGSVVVDSDVPFPQIGSVENHFDRIEIQHALQDEVGVATRRSETVGRDFMYVARRVSLDEGADILAAIRIIRIAAPLDELHMSINQIRSIIFITGAIVLLIVIFVSVFLSRKISGPLVDLAARVEEIRSGNLDKHIEVTTDDEIALVARTLNELLDKLKSDIGRLKKLEKFRSEFLGNVSHELRTPIFSLQGFIETLLNGAIDDPSVNRDFLEKAFAHATRLNNLLNDLINISQIESGEMKMSFYYFPVREFLESVVREMQPVAEQQHVVLRSRFPSFSGDLQVLGDKERLFQVMRNLVQNAVKYNKPYGEVIVSFERKTNAARITVSDTGIGMREEHLPRIFERFYRVDRDRSREVGGTGLGLAIVKHIVEAHGASILVTSEYGKGSTFSFELKAMQAT
jgi:two-component system, OmpR family, phosphate regulon sensor histidine kinase PhoR